LGPLLSLKSNLIYLNPFAVAREDFKCCKFNALSYFTDLIKHLENFKNCLKLKSQIDFSWFILRFYSERENLHPWGFTNISARVSIERGKQIENLRIHRYFDQNMQLKMDLADVFICIIETFSYDDYLF